MVNSGTIYCDNRVTSFHTCSTGWFLVERLPLSVPADSFVVALQLVPGFASVLGVLSVVGGMEPEATVLQLRRAAG